VVNFKEIQAMTIGGNPIFQLAIFSWF